MSEDQIPEVEDVVEVVDVEEPDESPIPQGPNLKTGYMVGTSEDNNFVFNLVAEQTSLVELLGLHQYATLRIQRILEDKTGGDPLTMEVGRLVLSLQTKVDALLKQSGAVKPENEL